MTLIYHVIEVATIKHNGQSRRCCCARYHSSFGGNKQTKNNWWYKRDEVLYAAVFHDTLEDTQTSKEDLFNNLENRLHQCLL